MNGQTLSFFQAVVQWQALHGRSHLPWQQTRDPYRVWLSEIMLQQTQVVTVLDYYERFLDRFPDVASLAAASEDEVMALWSGLGYYSRARNLHRCAQQVMQLHGGYFPASAQVLQTLSGIGRSTAGAIAAFCFSERVPILDANVRRVLTRVFGFDGDLSVAENERALWVMAAGLLPDSELAESMPRYTQGLMDLGAMVCLPRKPLCLVCPMQSRCVAFKQSQPESYPVKTRKLTRKSEAWWLLFMRDPAGRIWLERRPSKGIWAGLYCVPVCSSKAALLNHAAGNLNVGTGAVTSATAAVNLYATLPAFLHVLTHRDLHLHPIMLDVSAAEAANFDAGWFTRNQWQALGLPAPIRKLIDTL